MSKSTVVRFMFVDDDYRALYFLAVTDSNELKQGQISNKSVKMKSYDLALSEFKIFEGQLFKLDPCSVFAISENCLISGLRLDNTFTVTKFYPTRESTSITFHKVPLAKL